jgi:ElaB/YqjD/DUF883 family membrane-anchored ribosome-binding protein
MDQASDLMNKDPDEIRGNIEETRSALTEKLETLEQGVKETVHEAKAVVTGTIENVKDTVKETVETVKETLDIRCYVQEYPWPMMAGSMALGFALGRLISTSFGNVHSNGHRISRMASNGTPMQAQQERLPSSEIRQPEPKESRSAVLGSLMDRIRPEIEEIEGIAVGAVGALIRDLIRKNAAQPIAEQLAPVANRLTSKLGGRVIQEPLLSQAGDEE